MRLTPTERTGWPLVVALGSTDNVVTTDGSAEVVAAAPEDMVFISVTLDVAIVESVTVLLDADVEVVVAVLFPAPVPGVEVQIVVISTRFSPFSPTTGLKDTTHCSVTGSPFLQQV